MVQPYHGDVIGCFIWELGTGDTSYRRTNGTSWICTTETSWWRITETSFGVSFETCFRRREDVLMRRHQYVHCPIWRVISGWLNKCFIWSGTPKQNKYSVPEIDLKHFILSVLMKHRMKTKLLQSYFRDKNCAFHSGFSGKHFDFCAKNMKN